MADKLQKNLNKFSEKEKQIVKKLLLQIKENKLDILNIKKLKGRDGIYRARHGRIRIIYRINKDEIKLLTIEK